MLTKQQLIKAVALGTWDTFVAWQKFEAVTFIGWAVYKTFRLFRPKNGELTPNTMKIWSQFAYIDNPSVAAKFWTDVPWEKK